MTTIQRSPTLPVKHPGLVFKERCLDTHQLSVTFAAQKLHMSRKQVSLFVNGKSRVSIELAKKLQIATGISTEFWINRQQKYDLHQSHSLEVDAEPLYAFG